jgi:hypothetical protein
MKLLKHEGPKQSIAQKHELQIPNFPLIQTELEAIRENQGSPHHNARLDDNEQLWSRV